MKRFTITIFIGLLASLQTGCGIVEELSRACVPGDIQFLCQAVLGKHPDSKKHDVVEVSPAEPEVTQEDLDALIVEVTTLRDLLLLIQVSVIENYEAAQMAINDIVIRLAELETNLMVKELIDPCGDGPGHDEVILRMTDGTLISYFEQSNRRFLTKLGAGNYKTTDQQGCLFTILPDGSIQ